MLTKLDENFKKKGTKQKHCKSNIYRFDEKKRANKMKLI